MTVEQTNLPDVKIITPRVFGDSRGYFLETWSKREFEKEGIPTEFVQDNLSHSQRGVLRGLHYQYPRAQDKLVSVVKGEILDVALDIRRGSKIFGKWTSALLSESNHRQMFVPKGFAHGFVVLSDEATVTYKCTDFYYPEDEGGIIWNDPALRIDWKIDHPILSPKDSAFGRLAEIDSSRLPSIR